MKKLLLFIFIGTASHVFCETQGYVDATSIWPSSKINVCWENDGSATEKQWVRQALEDTWEDVSVVDFRNWGRCPEPADYWTWDWNGYMPVYRHKYTFNGIRIRINDEGPHTQGLGTEIKGIENGMVLNFTFNNWSTAFCQANRQFCIETIAVHEFGHAIGMAHEHNRPDTPPAICTDDPQGSNGNVIIGEWDLNSIMNYCNPAWNNNGNLSQGDIETINWMYPYPMSTAEVNNPDDYGEVFTSIPRLEWSEVDPYVSEFVTYDVYFGEEPENMELISQGQSETFLNIEEGLDLNKSYFWKVDVHRSQQFELDGFWANLIHPIDDGTLATNDFVEGETWRFTVRPNLVTTVYTPILLN